MLMMLPSYFSATTMELQSTEESLIVYRKSENNISSSSCWNVEKSKAALKYYQWIIDEFPMKQQDEQIIQQRLDFDLYTYFSAALNIHQSAVIINVHTHPRSVSTPSRYCPDSGGHIYPSKLLRTADWQVWIHLVGPATKLWSNFISGFTEAIMFISGSLYQVAFKVVIPSLPLK